MSDKVVFSSSLFPQYDIEIDGQSFKLKAVNRAVFDLLADIQRMANAQDANAMGKIYDQLALIIEAPKEFLDSLDYRLVRQIMSFINDKVIAREHSGEEKNGSELGEVISH
jgi:hypothetical protein